MAKARKSAKKSSAKKASAAKKSGAKRKAKKASPKELNLRPLKKQLRAHITQLSTAPTAKNGTACQSAIANLQRLHDALNVDCDPTMTIPLA